MHWIIQSNYHYDAGTKELFEILDRNDIPYSTHTVVPIFGNFIPDVDLPNPVIVIGSYAMRHVAKEKGWKPGCFDLGDITFQTHREHWGDEMLNADAKIVKFSDILNNCEDEFFIRPTIDSKLFTAQVYTKEEFAEWHAKVMALQNDHTHMDLTPDTDVVMSTPKNIQQEYRCWIVDRKVITVSLYKRSGRVLYSNQVDNDIYEYAQMLADKWSPLDCYVLDVARTEDGLRVIETNTLNAAGFYAANMSKLVQALEDYAVKVS